MAVYKMLLLLVNGRPISNPYFKLRLKLAGMVAHIIQTKVILLIIPPQVDYHVNNLLILF